MRIKHTPYLIVLLIFSHVVAHAAPKWNDDLDFDPKAETAKADPMKSGQGPENGGMAGSLDDNSMSTGGQNVSIDFLGKGDKGGPVDGGDNEEDDALKLDDSDLITVDFPDEEIRTILRNIADLYDLNLVIPDTLVGKTSIKLRDVSWRQVYQIILKPVGFTYAEEGNIIRVVSLDELNKEPMKLRTFSVKYAKAADVAAALGPIIGQEGGGSIQVDSRSNTLIVKDRPSALMEIENLLRNSTIDTPSLQVMIETKFIELSKTRERTGNQTGFDWWTSGALFGPGNNFLRVKGLLDVFNNFNSSDGHSFFRTAILSGSEYDMVLNMLETTQNANLVASPTVVTLNNRKANFHVGQKLPIIEANFDPTTGNFTVGQVTYLPVGVNVEVTPRVNAGAEQIILEVKPKVNKKIRDEVFSASGGGEIKYPVEQVRETHTNVSVKNGYTLALGGLIQDDDTVEVKKVPILGDLPWVGRIFKQKIKELEKRNLIMFMTAKVLDPNGGTYHDVIDPRQIADLGISDGDIPGYGNGIEMPGMAKMSDRHRELLQDLQECRNLDYDYRGKKQVARDMQKEGCCTGEDSSKKPKKRSGYHDRKSGRYGGRWL